jgi:Aspartyl protease
VPPAPLTFSCYRLLRRPLLRLVLASALAVILTACATSAIDATRWEAARECQQRFTRVTRVERIDHKGTLHYSYESPADNAGFEACYRERLRGKLATVPEIPVTSHAAPMKTGSVTSVPVAMLQGMAFVRVVVNDGPGATLLLDTGSTHTVLSPRHARQLGISVPSNARQQIVQVVGGATITMPLVRVRSVSVGGLSVEELDIGIYEALPNGSGADGLLGSDFLRHFKVSVNQDAKQLTLEVVRPDRTSAGQVAHAVTTEPVPPPRWIATPLTLTSSGEVAIGRRMHEHGLSVVIAFTSPVGGPKAAGAQCESWRSSLGKADPFAGTPCQTMIVTPADRERANYWVGYAREPSQLSVILGGTTPEICRSLFLAREEEHISWERVACVPATLRLE